MPNHCHVYKLVGVVHDSILFQMLRIQKAFITLDRNMCNTFKVKKMDHLPTGVLDRAQLESPFSRTYELVDDTLFNLTHLGLNRIRLITAHNCRHTLSAECARAPVLAGRRDLFEVVLDLRLCTAGTQCQRSTTLECECDHLRRLTHW